MAGPGVHLKVTPPRVPSRILCRARPRHAPPAVDIGRPAAFHQTMPGYAPTRLVKLDEVARTIGVASVHVKDESARLGLPSFKVLGSSWAVHRLVMRRAGRDPVEATWADLLEAAAKLRPLTLCTATDGNHGRGVARVARQLGFDAVVLVPHDTVPARIEAIAREGATVRVHPGNYDEAVAAVEQEAAIHGWEVVADVATDAGAEVPRWVMDGYDTIFEEVERELAAPPTVVIVQAGVGALAGSAVRHWRHRPDVRFAVVEPLSAACLYASAEAGRPVSLAEFGGSIMAGLICGTPSVVAWPHLEAGVDVFCAIDDDRAREAMRLLAGTGIIAGESGAAGLAGLLDVADDAAAREALGIDADARVLVVNTEGATDPGTYRAVVGTSDHPPPQ